MSEELRQFLCNILGAAEWIAKKTGDSTDDKAIQFLRWVFKCDKGCSKQQ